MVGDPQHILNYMIFELLANSREGCGSVQNHDLKTVVRERTPERDTDRGVRNILAHQIEKSYILPHVKFFFYIPLS